MICTLTFVALGLLQTGTIEIVPLKEAPPAASSAASEPATPITVTKASASKSEPAFDLEGLQLDQAFVVLRESERPAWVASPPQLQGSGAHSIAIASDPWKTDFEAQESLDKKLQSAVEDYINDQLGRPDAAQRLHLPAEFISDKLVGERYAEDLQFSDAAIGAMKQLHARLVFTPEFRAEIAERWKEHVVNARLLRTGASVAGVLVLLVLAFGVLKRLGGR